MQRLKIRSAPLEVRAVSESTFEGVGRMTSGGIQVGESFDRFGVTWLVSFLLETNFILTYAFTGMILEFQLRIRSDSVENAFEFPCYSGRDIAEMLQKCPIKS
ncbi:hypothetical protein CEXT_387591 [Caerostris extrusa]|uniref:Uncharacterized protein n=1 Tax=Caerostris extrusa TaxID=172846 RepID=A0AAV4UNN6_CAEEX|nr:hypothetical protein CEXT_387591 [Caerostris extrusa]